MLEYGRRQCRLIADRQPVNELPKRRRPVELCYMCEEVSTSREHVPPLCFFPEAKDRPDGGNLRKDLITVPSCEVHNSRKSRADERLMMRLATVYQGNEVKRQHFESKVMRAFVRGPAVLRDTMPDLTPVTLEAADGTKFESAMYRVKVDDFDDAIRHIACGLLFHKSGVRWTGTVKVHSNAFVHIDGPDAALKNEKTRHTFEAISALFMDIQALGANPQVFTFKVVSMGGAHAVLMDFYEGVRFVALFTAPVKK